VGEPWKTILFGTWSKVPNIQHAYFETMAPEAQPRVEGIRVDVPSYLAPDDFHELIDLCVPFDDGRRCHMGVGSTRVFLVHPSRVTEANKILKKYEVEIVNGKQARAGTHGSSGP
jgi:hypothetical protein